MENKDKDKVYKPTWKSHFSHASFCSRTSWYTWGSWESRISLRTYKQHTWFSKENNCLKTGCCMTR